MFYVVIERKKDYISLVSGWRTKIEADGFVEDFMEDFGDHFETIELDMEMSPYIAEIRFDRREIPIDEGEDVREVIKSMLRST